VAGTGNINLNPSDPSRHSLDDILHAAPGFGDSDLDRDSAAGDSTSTENASDNPDRETDNDSHGEPYDDEDNLSQEGESEWVDPRSGIIPTWELLAEDFIVDAERYCKFLAAVPVVRHGSPTFHQVRADLTSNRTISIISASLI
jgi:hypothetical protein